MIIAVGDVHGEFEKLEKLMNNLQQKGYKPEDHQYVFLGDLVDGGANTKKVVEFVRKLQKTYNVTVLKGNHEDMLIDAVLKKSVIYGHFNQWWSQGGKETAYSYEDKVTKEKVKQYPFVVFGKSDLIWLMTRPLFLETKNFFFVHAGLRPKHSFEDQTTEDMLWIREPFLSSDYQWEKVVVYGHTFTQEIRYKENSIGIDTMYFGKGPLTAVVLDDDLGQLYDIITDGEEAYVPKTYW